MCIIVAKNVGVEVPSKDTFLNCFNHNKDGAGFAYSDNGHVVIKKGFMTFDSFYSALSEIPNLKDRALIAHFRIGTHGKNNAENTHPFPISDNLISLRRLKMLTNTAIAHNGIISSMYMGTQATHSDTMEYIASNLALLWKYDKNCYKSPYIKELIKEQTSSKFAIINGEEEIHLIGEFLKDGDVYYSNNSYQSYATIYSKYYGSVYDDDDYSGYTYYGKTNTKGYISLRTLPEDAIISDWVKEFPENVADKSYKRVEIKNDYYQYLMDYYGNVYEYFDDDSYSDVVHVPTATCKNYKYGDLFSLKDSYIADYYCSNVPPKMSSSTRAFSKEVKKEYKDHPTYFIDDDVQEDTLLKLGFKKSKDGAYFSRQTEGYKSDYTIIKKNNAIFRYREIISADGKKTYELGSPEGVIDDLVKAEIAYFYDSKGV